MTSAFLRVKRGNEWVAIEVEHLTDSERDEQFINRTPEELVRWMHTLSRELVKAEKILDDLVDDGILQKSGLNS